MVDRIDQRTAQACRDYLTALSDATRARQAMHDGQRGQPRSASTDPGSRGAPGASPVEAALTQPDHGGQALRASKRDRLEAAQALERETARIRAWAPHRPGAAAQATTSAHPDRLCDHCGQANLRAHAPTDVRGNLKRPLRLCRWCYDRTAKTGSLPSRRDLDRRQTGQRIRD